MAKPFEVLLASDFTARSDRPLDRAIRLAAERGGGLAIAHVVEGKAEVAAGALSERLRADLPDEAAAAELVIETGSVPEALSRIASGRGSDLIVTGVARYNGIGDYLLGTTVDHVIRNSAVPVLVVRRRVRGAYRRLLVAVDHSDCSRAALLAAARLFPHARIAVTHAFHVPYEGWFKSEDVRRDVRADAQAGLDAFLAHPDIAPVKGRIDALVGEGETATVVARQLALTGADLLVLGTHGRSGFVHATIGSQAEALLAAVDVDVLLVRE